MELMIKLLLGFRFVFFCNFFQGLRLSYILDTVLFKNALPLEG